MKKIKALKGNSPTKEISGGDILSPSLAGADKVSSPFVGQENNMKTKQSVSHVPVLWYLVIDPDSGNEVIVDAPDGGLVVGHSHGDRVLMAAAPSMLIAMKTALDALDAHTADLDEVKDAVIVAKANLRAAIAKATGESNEN